MRDSGPDDPLPAVDGRTPAIAGRAMPPGSAGLERAVSRLLTVGMVMAISLLAIGLVLMVGRGIGPLAGGPRFDSRRLVDDLAGLRPAGFLWLGLLVVVGTPAMRVAAALAGYLRMGERTMALVSGLILLVIGMSVGLAVGLGD